MIEIAQAEDRCYKWRLAEHDMWQGGYRTYDDAWEAALAALIKRGL